MNTSASSEVLRPQRVTGRERGLAVGSLVCGLLVAVALIVLATRNVGFLVLALVGLAVAVGGMWWAATERMPRRGIGIAGGVIGLTVMVLAVIWVTPHGDRPLLRLVLVAVLLVAAVGLAQGRAPA